MFSGKEGVYLKKTGIIISCGISTVLFLIFFSKGGFIPCTSYFAFNFRCNNGTAYLCF